MILLDEPFTGLDTPSVELLERCSAGWPPRARRADRHPRRRPGARLGPGALPQPPPDRLRPAGRTLTRAVLEATYGGAIVELPGDDGARRPAAPTTTMHASAARPCTDPLARRRSCSARFVEVVAARDHGRRARLLGRLLRALLQRRVAGARAASRAWSSPRCRVAAARRRRRRGRRRRRRRSPLAGRVPDDRPRHVGRRRRDDALRRSARCSRSRPSRRPACRACCSATCSGVSTRDLRSRPALAAVVLAALALLHGRLLAVGFDRAQRARRSACARWSSTWRCSCWWRSRCSSPCRASATCSSSPCSSRPRRPRGWSRGGWRR